MNFEIILTDCPWQYNARRNPKTKFGGGAMGHYPTMKFQDLCALPVEQLAAKPSQIFSWATGPKVMPAGDLLKAWGFDYCTFAFTWIKTYPKSGTLVVGPGFYTGSNAEVCLLGRKRRGRAIRLARRLVSQVMELPVKDHSRKPDEVWRRIELMYPAQNKIELFAREQRPGWTTVGNEIDGEDIQMALRRLIDDEANARGRAEDLHRDHASSPKHPSIPCRAWLRQSDH